MLKLIIGWLTRLFRRPPSQDQPQRYFSKITRLPSMLGTVETDERILVLVGPEIKAKWLRFKCPCGCNEELALNLMESHYPHWKATLHEDGTMSVSPSVDNTTCGAHFWIRHSDIDWCA